MTQKSTPQELFIEWPHTKVSITDLKVRTTTKPLTGVKTPDPQSEVINTKKGIEC